MSYWFASDATDRDEPRLWVAETTPTAVKCMIVACSDSHYERTNSTTARWDSSPYLVLGKFQVGRAVPSEPQG